MICPICGEETKVVDSRADVDYIHRRRQCLKCSYRFTTIEIDADLYEKLLKKRDKTK